MFLQVTDVKKTLSMIKSNILGLEATLQAQLRAQEIDLESMKQVNTWQEGLGLVGLISF